MTSTQCSAACLLFSSAFLSAISQLLLKQSADLPHTSPIHAYLNGRVLGAYAIFSATVFVNIWAFRSLDYKYGEVLLTSSYGFVLLLSRLVLREKITASVFCGNLLIAIGIAVYLFS